jgi:enoyl-CoA hydratase/carnithine racemase
VQARAIGAGAMLAVVADECLAAETVRFSFPEIDLGMPSPLGCAVIAVRSSANLARRLIQTGEHVDSGRALALGLVDEVVPGDALRARSVERARLHGKRAGPAYAANKTWLNREMRAAIERAAEEGERLQHAISAGRSATNAA